MKMMSGAAIVTIVVIIVGSLGRWGSWGGSAVGGVHITTVVGILMRRGGITAVGAVTNDMGARRWK